MIQHIPYNPLEEFMNNPVTYISLVGVWTLLGILCIGYALLVSANRNQRMGAALAGVGLLLTCGYYILRAMGNVGVGDPVTTEIFRIFLIAVGAGFLPIVGVPLFAEITRRDKQWREK